MTAALVCSTSLALAGAVVFALAYWLAFRKAHAEHLTRIAGKLAGDPVDMTTRIWTRQDGKTMCENDGRER